MAFLLLLGILFTGVPGSSQSSKIVFISDGNIYEIDAALGAPAVLIPQEIREHCYSYCVGNNLTLFLEDWSPDGKVILISQYATTYTSIWSIGSDGSNPRELVRQPSYVEIPRYRTPRWSPDGSRFAAWVDGRLKLFQYPERGGTAAYRDTGIRDFYYYFDWMPDGRFVYWGEHQGQYGILAVNEDGTEERLIFDPPLEEETSAIDFRASPDGRKILFVQYKWNEFRETAAIWLVGIDGSNPHHLVDGWAGSWAPDSRHIAFLRGDGRIYVVDADTGYIQVLYDNPEIPAGKPLWSPWLSDSDRVIEFPQPTSVTATTWGEVKSAYQTTD